MLQTTASELDDILEGSAASMAAAGPVETIGQCSAWWTQRRALDERLGQLLERLDTHTLGPWR